MMIYTPEFENLAKQVERLERDNRQLLERVAKLEKQKGSFLAALLGNALLLVVAGLLVGYLGFFPKEVDRLPLSARKVEAEEFVLRNKEGAVLARLQVTDNGFQFLDASGAVLFSKP